MKHTYLEIVQYKPERVVKRIDVTGKGERTVERMEDGANINLNHQDYYTIVNEYDQPQTII